MGSYSILSVSIHVYPRPKSCIPVVTFISHSSLPKLRYQAHAQALYVSCKCFSGDFLELPVAYDIEHKVIP